MEKKLFLEAGFKGKGRTIHRKINDVVQVVNFQRSNYSDEEYINVAIWPLVLGEPASLIEYKFPIRGRIEDFVQVDRKSPEEASKSLLNVLASSLSSLDRIKEERRNGRLDTIYLSWNARELLQS